MPETVALGRPALKDIDEAQAVFGITGAPG